MQTIRERLFCDLLDPFRLRQRSTSAVSMKANTRRTQPPNQPPNQPPRRRSIQAKNVTDQKNQDKTAPDKKALKKKALKKQEPKLSLSQTVVGSKTQAQPRSKFFPPRSPQPTQPPKPPLKQRLQTVLKKTVANSFSHLLPLIGLLAIAALIAGGGVLGAKFILEPKSIAWVNDYLPEGLQVPVPEWDRPQTLDDIKKNLTQNDHQLGDIIELNNHDRLIPIHQNGYNCLSKCDHIAEIRIYRPTKGNGPKRNQPHFRLIAQLDVGPVQDWTIAESLAQSENGPSETSGGPLPLETYEAMESPESSTGTWFNLTGKRQQGEYNVTYGQLFHYDANTSQITALMPWSSPSAENPIVWKQLTGSQTPELLIDHSIGLEPKLQAYQVFLKGTPSLTPISLTQVANPDPVTTHAINLAKVGLWSLAADRLTQLKSSGGQWGSTAQAQLDLIQYHAKLTQDQAKQNWANTHQQVLVKLMDGQWQNALKVLEKDPLMQSDIRESFKTETARLWKRLSVAIEDDPSNPALQAWMAMVMLDRDGTAKTKTWLTAQGSSSARSRALELLAPTLLPPKATPKPTPKPTESAEAKPEVKPEVKPEQNPIATLTSPKPEPSKATSAPNASSYPIAY